MTNFVAIISNGITNYVRLIPKNFSLFDDIIIPILPGAITGVIIGILVYLTTSWVSQRRIKITKSIVGDALLASFADEVQTGLKIMNDINNYLITYKGGMLQGVALILPDKSWEGMKSIPDDILERIILVADKGVIEILRLHKLGTPIEEHNEEPEPLFRPKFIKIHLKNYFEFICPQMNKFIFKLLHSTYSSANSALDKDIKYCKTIIEETNKVLNTLHHIRIKLLENSEILFPK